MNLIVFLHYKTEKEGQPLRNRLGALTGLNSIEYCSDFESFKERLQQPVRFERSEVFILFAAGQEQLQKFSAFNPYFEDRRIIIILPDDSPETIDGVLKLRPRYFTTKNDTYDDLCAVLKKLM